MRLMMHADSQQAQDTESVAFDEVLRLGHRDGQRRPALDVLNFEMPPPKCRRRSLGSKSYR